MSKKNQKTKPSEHPDTDGFRDPFLKTLSQVIIDHDGNLSEEHQFLIRILSDPKSGMIRQKDGTLTARENQRFKPARELAGLIDDLSAEEVLRLIPKDREGTKAMQAFARRCGFEKEEDTIWRPLTGYPNVNHAWTGMIAERFQDVKALEIMAGNGLLAYMLSEHGLPVIATDMAPGRDNDYVSMRHRSYADVTRIDAVSAVKRFGAGAGLLIVSWPPEGEEEVLKALKAYQHMKPDGKILYLGEWKGGCNATDVFFDALTVVDELSEINREHLSHIGSHDVIRLLKMKDSLCY